MLHVDVQTLVGVTGLLTTFAPYIAAVFTQQHYHRWVNELIALTVSIFFGALSWFVAGGNIHDVHDIGSLYAAIGFVVIGAKVYYEKLAKASPALVAIEWWTGGKQAGFPKPVAAFTASTSVSGEALPSGATDSKAVSADPGQDIDPAGVPDLVDGADGEPSASAAQEVAP